MIVQTLIWTCELGQACLASFFIGHVTTSCGIWTFIAWQSPQMLYWPTGLWKNVTHLYKTKAQYNCEEYLFVKASRIKLADVCTKQLSTVMEEFIEAIRLCINLWIKNLHIVALESKIIRYSSVGNTGFTKVSTSRHQRNEDANFCWLNLCLINKIQIKIHLIKTAFMLTARSAQQP